MKKKIKVILILLVVIGISVFILIRYFYIFGTGVKSGQLNYIVKKGYVFKTYEGKMVQSGFQTNQSGIQSNEFIFSIDDERVAEKLMLNQGTYVSLRYHEYLGRLPWRGHSKYVVDSILVIDDKHKIDSNLPPVTQ